MSKKREQRSAAFDGKELNIFVTAASLKVAWLTELAVTAFERATHREGSEAGKVLHSAMTKLKTDSKSYGSQTLALMTKFHWTFKRNRSAPFSATLSTKKAASLM